MEIADSAMAKSLYLCNSQQTALKVLTDCCWWERSPISLLVIDYNYFTIAQFKIFMKIAINLVPHVKKENPWKTFLE